MTLPIFWFSEIELIAYLLIAIPAAPKPPIVSPTLSKDLFPVRSPNNERKPPVTPPTGSRLVIPPPLLSISQAKSKPRKFYDFGFFAFRTIHLKSKFKGLVVPVGKMLVTSEFEDDTTLCQDIGEEGGRGYGEVEDEVWR